MKNVNAFHLLIITLFSCVTPLKSSSQVDFSKKYDFHPPLNIPLVLAANFGELRSNHFHTGLDFKTNRKEGYKIHAIDDGYVSRIKVSPYGYGHVVYIDHYNGLSSVYAHCAEFSGDLAKLASEQQFKNKHFEFEYYPSKDSLKVTKGQVIALSGNTGGSSAPHLHFEIRETETQHALNPLLFDFAVKDTRKPTIRAMRVYGVTADGYRIPGKQKQFGIFGGNGNFSVSGNTVNIPANYLTKEGGIGLSFDAIDQLDAADNICGIYIAHLVVDGDTIFTQKMNEIAFESNRYINCHKDYEAYHKERRQLQKTFKTTENPMPIYEKVIKNGIIQISAGESKNIQYICQDTEGNTSRLNFKLEITNGDIDSSPLFEGPHLKPSENFHFQDSNCLILFPPKSVYEPTPIVINTAIEKFTFGNPEVPLQTSYKIMMKKLDASNKDIIVRKDQRGRKHPENTTASENWLSCWTKNFGDFHIEQDTLAPEIKGTNFKNGATIQHGTLRFRFNDDLSGIKKYDIYFNEEWFPLFFDPKLSFPYYINIPEKIKGKTNVKIILEDKVNNQSEHTYQLNIQ